MNAVIDLPRARKALAALDKIAAEHPEMCQGIGQWDEAAVEKITMGTPARDRVKAMRDRLAAQGIKREVFFATPEAQAALVELRALHPDKTRDNILCDALINLLAAMRPRAPATVATEPDTMPLFETAACPTADSPTALLAEVDRRANAGEKWRDIAASMNEAGWRDRNGKPLVYSRLNEQWRAWKRAKGESG